MAMFLNVEGYNIEWYNIDGIGAHTPLYLRDIPELTYATDWFSHQFFYLVNNGHILCKRSFSYRLTIGETFYVPQLFKTFMLVHKIKYGNRCYLPIEHIKVI